VLILNVSAGKQYSGHQLGRKSLYMPELTLIFVSCVGRIKDQRVMTEKQIDDAQIALKKEKERARIAAYRAANPEKVKASLARYRAANREKIKVMDAKYRAANLERIKARDAAYFAANRENIYARKRVYRAAKKAEAEAAIRTTGDNHD
jgi:hypothetical protein